jgi:hypothetical protein
MSTEVQLFTTAPQPPKWFVRYSEENIVATRMYFKSLTAYFALPLAQFPFDDLLSLRQGFLDEFGVHSVRWTRAGASRVHDDATYTYEAAYPAVHRAIEYLIYCAHQLLYAEHNIPKELCALIQSYCIERGELYRSNNIVIARREIVKPPYTNAAKPKSETTESDASTSSTSSSSSVRVTRSSKRQFQCS